MSTDDETVAWYNANAKEYAEHVRNPKDSVYHSFYEKPAMYSLLPDLHDKKVLSIGCGSGEDSTYLKQQGALESVGVDISQELIALAAASYPECTFKTMDMEKLDFPAESFDFAYSSLAIHYLPDWSQTFREVYRVLKPGSYFLFSCSHPVTSAMEVTENTEDTKVRQLSIRNQKRTNSVEITGDYLNRRSMKDGAGAMQVTTWHKPLSEIIEESQAAGFTINKFVEPKPLEQMRDVSPNNYDRLNKIPFFAIFRLYKA